MNLRSVVFLLIAGVALAATVTPAAATILAPGATVLLPGTTGGDTPALVGNVEASSSVLIDFNPEPLFLQSYRFETEVRSSDLTGATIISHRFADAINTFPSFLYIDGFSLTGYSVFETDVFFRTDGPGDRAPTFVERSGDGDVLDYTFALPLVNGFLTSQPQEESFAVEILTDANSFENTGLLTVRGRLLGSVTESVEFTVGGIAVPLSVPGVELPAPVPALLLVTGLIALAGARRRRY